MNKLLIGCGVTFGVVVFLVLAACIWLGLMMESGSVPDTAIIPGNKLSTPAREAIAAVVTLRPDESIRYVYGSGLLSWEEDGNLITNQRVVSYYQDEGSQYVSEADYADIVEVNPTFSDMWAEDSTLSIVTADGDDFVLLLSNEGDLDHTAVKYVQRQVARQRAKAAENGRGNGELEEVVRE